jgi:Flp pilus assembly protein TadB
MLLLTGLGALAIAVIAVVVALTVGRPERAVARTLKTADAGYRLPTPAAAAPTRTGSIPRPAQVVGQALTPPAMAQGLRRRLDQAGNPTWLGADSVIAWKGLGLFCGAMAGLLLGVLLSGPLTWIVWIAAGAALGFFAPDLLVMHLAQERQEEIRRNLPDVMDTLVVSVEAGLGFEAAVAQVVRNGRGPMIGEFARVLHEMQIGRPRVDAVRDLAARTNVPELRAFASAIVQATTLGVPLGKVLRQQSAELRLRRRQRAEELAQRVPVKILFPMVFCIFPALFVVVIGPGVIRILEGFGG